MGHLLSEGCRIIQDLQSQTAKQPFCVFRYFRLFRKLLAHFLCYASQSVNLSAISPKEFARLDYSIVVPFHNEEGNLPELYRRLTHMLEALDVEYELVFVDDGSSDRTSVILKDICALDPRVTGLRLRRNFGQTAALAAGFDRAAGEVIIAMDGDLQHAPEDIPRFIEKLKEGYDIVSGWRQNRQDGMRRTFPSRIANQLMAKASGVSPASVQRIWHAHGLKPHLVKTFKLSNDPHFVEKLRDVVGLYMNPPENALVLSIDEKSQIQALDRTQPGLPMKKGRAGTMTHDYKRNGVTTLFAALDVLKGEVIGQCLPRHRHQEFLKFLTLVDKQAPQHLDLHCIVDNYATHKKKEVKEWLSRNPRFHFHFIPTGSSWLNLVERWFRSLTADRIRRDAFSSVTQLQTAIYDYIKHNNENPKPFVWTQSADNIIAKVNRGKAILVTLH